MTLDTSVSATSIGWDDRWHEAAAHAGPGTPGRVVRADRSAVQVLLVDLTVQPPGLATDPVTATLHPAAEPPVTGDWVVVSEGRVRAVLARRTSLVRGAGRTDTRGQALAANVDVVVVVHAATEPPNHGRLERLVTLAWSSGATPLVVLSKADLAGDLSAEVRETEAVAPGVEVLTVSAASGEGMDVLRERLGGGRTCVLLGRSGAGKTTITNTMAGSDLAVREIRQLDGKGQHTTVARHLVVLPDGSGALLDTPGLRGVQLWDSGEGLAHTFAEIDELLGGCRFADCAHGTEPGCAVLEAVAEGRVEQARLDSWRRLQREDLALAARHDARLRADQLKVWKQRSKGNRQREQITGKPQKR